MRKPFFGNTVLLNRFFTSIQIFMKKAIFALALSALVAGVFVVVTSYITPAPAPPNNTLAMCLSPNSNAILYDAPAFDPEKYKTDAVMIRKNVYSLSAAEIASIELGVENMKLASGPTSWAYQANIHGSATAGSVAWSTCQHGNEFFLSWHRMYLYYFERILRAKSGNANLTLPYWNYQTNAALHPDYCNSSASNSLYDGTRNATINAGGSLSPSISSSINTSLAQIPFINFQSQLENVHGSVHVAIGGNMTTFSNAGKDPCFWLHHANIDRIWEVWLKQCDGRANPTTSPWTTQVFTFFDENGAAVNMTGAQVVNTASMLNYKYDLTETLPCNIFLKPNKSRYLASIRPLRIPDPGPWIKNPQLLSLKNAKNLDDVRLLTNLELKLTDPNLTDRVSLELNNLKIEKLPEGVVEVYVNLPSTEKPDPKSKSFAGLVDFFTAPAHAAHQKKVVPVSINLTPALQNLKLRTADLSKMNLTFFVRGNVVNGKSVATKLALRMESADLVIERAVLE